MKLMIGGERGTQGREEESQRGTERRAKRRERRERRAQSMSRNDDAEDMSDDRFARCFGVLGRCQSRVPVMAVPDAMIAKGGLAYL